MSYVEDYHTKGPDRDEKMRGIFIFLLGLLAVVAVGLIIFGAGVWIGQIREDRSAEQDQAALEEEFEARLEDALSATVPGPASVVPAPPTTSPLLVPTTSTSTTVASSVPESIAPSETTLVVNSDESTAVRVDGPQRPTQVSLGEPMARIEIPSIGLSKVAVEGARGQDLARGGFAHHSTSFQIGEGTSIFACHRTSHGGPCRYMNGVSEGDSIFATTLDGVRHEYRVARISTVPAWQAPEFLRPYAGDMLTIYTCTPTGSTRNRLIIQSVPVNSEG